jgi:toxin CptA
MLWLYGGRVMDWRLFLAVAVTTLAGWTAYIGWKNSPVGQLAWDGQFWRWEGPGYQAGIAEQKLSVVVDFQNLLLLRLENQAHAHLWVWAERHVLPDRWLDFRRAVYSPVKAVRKAPQDDLQALEPMLAVAVSVHALPTNFLPKP